MKHFILLLSLVFCLTSAAQKKKDPYAKYWEQQAVEEQFEKLSAEGHTLFEQAKLIQAKKKYKEALALKPKDQQTIAILRDIDLLLEKKKLARADSISPQAIITMPPPKRDIPKTKAPPKEPTPPPQPQTKPPESIRQKPKNPPPVREATEEKKVPPKNTPQFREYLANNFQPGWTEETYMEGKKQVVKRIHVTEGLGDEYMQITHHYGAVYYFKNGRSISYATWVAETEKK